MGAEESSTIRLPEAHFIQQKAEGSSFYAAMRLMPKIERRAMFNIYAFCRTVDDIADEGIFTRTERYAQLEAWRSDLAELYAGGPGGRAAFLLETIRRFGQRQEDFIDIIDGMQMDVASDIHAPSLAILDLYCERVASAVARLSVKVFNMEDEPGSILARHLGRALQLTNILRDLDEDALVNRLYLPREYLEEAGIAIRSPSETIADPRVDHACRALATLAHQHYNEAFRVLKVRPKGLIRTPKLMGAIYFAILEKMERAGWAPPRRRVRLSKLTLLSVVAANALFT